MKVKLEVDCTPKEARSFLGLPDVEALNKHMVDEMKSRIDAGIGMAAPEELMKSWMNLGGQATEQFRKLMTTAMAAAGSTSRPG